MANPFYVAPVNAFQVFQSGQQGYQQGQDRLANQTLAELLKSASPDYKQAAGVLADAGKIDQAFSLLKLANEQAANAQFSGALGNWYGGGQPSAPAPMVASPPLSGPPARPEVMPTTANPLGRTGGPVPTSAAVVGDQEGIASGLYDPPAVNRPAPAAIPTPAPPIPSSAPTLGGRPVSGVIPALIPALANSSLGQSQRAIGLELLKHAFEDSKQPDKVKLYNVYRQQGGNADFTTWDRENARAGAITEADAFEKTMSTEAAKRWGGYIEAGGLAEKKMVDVNTMRDISRRLGTQGAAAGVKEVLGPYADALGIKIDGLSDIQTFSSVVQRLAPKNRVEGSGPTSDIEFKGMVKSMPGLIQNPAAREAILDTLEAEARHDIARGQIASRLAAKEITRGQAEQMTRALGDPMERFREWRKANPKEFGRALQGGGAAAPQSPGPAPTQQQTQRTGEPTARNPQTGQVLILRNGQWVPAQGL